MVSCKKNALLDKQGADYVSLSGLGTLLPSYVMQTNHFMNYAAGEIETLLASYEQPIPSYRSMEIHRKTLADFIGIAY